MVTTESIFNNILLLAVPVISVFVYYYYSNRCSKGGIHTWKNMTVKYKEVNNIFTLTKSCKKCGLWK